ncbi:MAG TPA: hypothetical protein VG944_19255 [Fimbriimonas sp.]|nr:hypothetical protein [Fimbriimonas sp.]
MCQRSPEAVVMGIAEGGDWLIHVHLRGCRHLDDLLQDLVPQFCSELEEEDRFAAV